MITVHQFLQKAEVDADPSLIMTDSYVLGAFLLSLDANVLERMPSFQPRPQSGSANERNFEAARRLVEQFQSTDQLFDDFDITVKLLVETLCLQQPFQGAEGELGLQKWIQHIMNLFQLDGCGYNELTVKKALFYCYSYLSESPEDLLLFQKGLEKDGLRLVIDGSFAAQDCYLQLCLLYRNVMEHGRPAYSLRVLDAQLQQSEAQRAIEAQIVQNSAELVGVVENNVRLNAQSASAMKQSLIQKIKAMCAKSYPALVSELTKIEQLQTDLGLHGGRSAVSMEELGAQLLLMFKSDRTAQDGIVKVVGQIAAVEMLQSSILVIDGSCREQYAKQYEKLQKIKESTKERTNLVLYVHDVLTEAANLRTLAVKKELIEAVKSQLVQNYHMQFKLENVTTIEDESIFLMQKVRQVTMQQTIDESNQFVRQYLELELSDVNAVLNAGIRQQSKQQTCQAFRKNALLYERLLAQIEDSELSKQYSQTAQLAELISQQDQDESGSGYAAQYAKLAVSLHDRLISEFEQLKDCIFYVDSQQDLNAREISQQLQKILSCNYLSVTEAELSRMHTGSLQYTYFINGQQLLKMRAAKIPDKNRSSQELIDLRELQNQMVSTGEQPPANNLGIINLDLINESVKTLHAQLVQAVEILNPIIEQSSISLATQSGWISEILADIKQIRIEFQTQKQRFLPDIDAIVCKDIYIKLRSIQSQLMQMDPLKAPAKIQLRFQQLLQCIFQDNLVNSINAQTNLILLSTTLKLIIEIDQLLLDLQQHCEKVERVLPLYIQGNGLKQRIDSQVSVIDGFSRCIDIQDSLYSLKIGSGAFTCSNIIDKIIKNELTSEIKDQIMRGQLILKKDICSQNEAFSNVFVNVIAIQKLLEMELVLLQQLGKRAQQKFESKGEICYFTNLIELVSEKLQKLDNLKVKYGQFRQNNAKDVKLPILQQEDLQNSQISHNDLLALLQSPDLDIQTNDIFDAISISQTVLDHAVSQLDDILQSKPESHADYLQSLFGLNIIQLDVEHCYKIVHLMNQKHESQRDTAKRDSLLTLSSITGTQAKVGEFRLNADKTSIEQLFIQVNQLRQTIEDKINEYLAIMQRFQVKDEAQHVVTINNDMKQFIRNLMINLKQYIQGEAVPFVKSFNNQDPLHGFIDFSQNLHKLNQQIAENSELHSNIIEKYNQMKQLLMNFFDNAFQNIKIYVQDISRIIEFLEEHRCPTSDAQKLRLHRQAAPAILQIIELLMCVMTREDQEGMVLRSEMQIVRLIQGRGEFASLLTCVHKQELQQFQEIIQKLLGSSLATPIQGDTDQLKTLIFEDTLTEFLCTAQYHMIGKDLEVHLVNLQNPTTILTKYQQVFGGLDTQSFGERFGCEPSPVAGSAESITRKLQKHETFVQYGKKLVQELRKLVVDSQFKNELEEKLVQIEQKRANSVRQELTEKAAQVALVQIVHAEKALKYDDEYDVLFEKLAKSPGNSTNIATIQKLKEQISGYLHQVKLLEGQTDARRQWTVSAGKIAKPFSSLLLIAEQKLKQLDKCANDCQVQYAIVSKIVSEAQKLDEVDKLYDGIMQQVMQMNDMDDGFEEDFAAQQSLYQAQFSKVLDAMQNETRITRDIISLVSQVNTTTNSESHVNTLSHVASRLEERQQLVRVLSVLQAKLLRSNERISRFQLQSDQKLIQKFMNQTSVQQLIAASVSSAQLYKQLQTADAKREFVQLLKLQKNKTTDDTTFAMQEGIQLQQLDPAEIIKKEVDSVTMIHERCSACAIQMLRSVIVNSVETQKELSFWISTAETGDVDAAVLEALAKKMRPDAQKAIVFGVNELRRMIQSMVQRKITAEQQVEHMTEAGAHVELIIRQLVQLKQSTTAPITQFVRLVQQQCCSDIDLQNTCEFIQAVIIQALKSIEQQKIGFEDIISKYQLLLAKYGTDAQSDFQTVLNSINDLFEDINLEMSYFVKLHESFSRVQQIVSEQEAADSIACEIVEKQLTRIKSTLQFTPLALQQSARRQITGIESQFDNLNPNSKYSLLCEEKQQYLESISSSYIMMQQLAFQKFGLERVKQWEALMEFEFEFEALQRTQLLRIESESLRSRKSSFDIVMDELSALDQQQVTQPMKNVLVAYLCLQQIIQRTQTDKTLRRLLVETKLESFVHPQIFQGQIKQFEGLPTEISDVFNCLNQSKDDISLLLVAQAQLVVPFIKSFVEAIPTFGIIDSVHNFAEQLEYDYAQYSRQMLEKLQIEQLRTDLTNNFNIQYANVKTELRPQLQNLIKEIQRSIAEKDKNALQQCEQLVLALLQSYCNLDELQYWLNGAELRVKLQAMYLKRSQYCYDTLESHRKICEAMYKQIKTNPSLQDILRFKLAIIQYQSFKALLIQSRFVTTQLFESEQLANNGLLMEPILVQFNIFSSLRFNPNLNHLFPAKKSDEQLISAELFMRKLIQQYCEVFELNQNALSNSQRFAQLDYICVQLIGSVFKIKQVFSDLISSQPEHSSKQLFETSKIELIQAALLIQNLLQDSSSVPTSYTTITQLFADCDSLSKQIEERGDILDILDSSNVAKLFEQQSDELPELIQMGQLGFQQLQSLKGEAFTTIQALLPRLQVLQVCGLQDSKIRRSPYIEKIVNELSSIDLDEMIETVSNVSEAVVESNLLTRYLKMSDSLINTILKAMKATLKAVSNSELVEDSEGIKVLIKRFQEALSALNTEQMQKIPRLLLEYAVFASLNPIVQSDIEPLLQKQQMMNLSYVHYQTGVQTKVAEMKSFSQLLQISSQMLIQTVQVSRGAEQPLQKREQRNVIERRASQFDRIFTLCSTVFDEIDQIIKVTQEQQMFEVAEQLIELPLYQTAYVKIALIQQILIELNAQLKLHQNIVTLPDRFGFIDNNMQELQPASQIYALLSNKEELTVDVCNLVNRFNDYARVFAEVQCIDTELKITLQKQQQQQQQLSMNSAVTDISHLLLCVFFDRPSSLLAEVDSAKLNQFDYSDLVFGAQLSQIVTRYLQSDTPENEFQALLIQQQVEMIQTVFAYIQKTQMAKAKEPVDNKLVQQPVVKYLISPLTEKLIQNKALLAKHAFQNTVSPIVQLQASSGEAVYKISEDLISVCSLKGVPQLAALCKVAQSYRQQHNLKSIESEYEDCQVKLARVFVAVESLATFYDTIQTEHAVRREKETSTAAQQLEAVLKLERVAQQIKEVQIAVQEEGLEQLITDQLVVQPNCLAQLLQLPYYVGQCDDIAAKLEAMKRDLSKMNATEAVDTLLQQISDVAGKLKAQQQKITQLEEKHLNPAELVRVARCVTQQLQTTSYSACHVDVRAEFLRRALEVAGEIEGLSWDESELEYAAQMNDAVTGVATLVKKTVEGVAEEETADLLRIVRGE